MTSVLFNMHNVMLLITIYICVLFAVFLLTIKKGSKKSNILLACFLLCHAAIPTDNLIMFGEAFRAKAIEFSPDIFMYLGLRIGLNLFFYFFMSSHLFIKTLQLVS